MNKLQKLSNLPTRTNLRTKSGLRLTQQLVTQYIFGRTNSILLYFTLTKLITTQFRTLGVIISEPKYFLSNGQLIVKLFYFSTQPLLQSQLVLLVQTLSASLGVSVTLILTSLSSPANEISIVAKTRDILSDKLRFTHNLRRIMTRLFNAAKVHQGNINFNILNHSSSALNGMKLATVSGFNVKLAGRLSREAIIPRKAVKIIQFGTKTIFNLDARLFSKNKKGIHCLTISQSFNF